MHATGRNARPAERHSDLRSLRCASFGSAAPGGHCRTLSFGKQASEVIATFLPPTRPFILSDLAECLSRVFPVLMAGDLNAKHPNWNSWWPQPGPRFMIRPAETAAWSMGRIDLPRFHRNLVRLPMSLILWLSSSSSYQCIWLPCTQLVSLTCPAGNHVSTILP
jgi:hypothetical protein